MAKRSAPSQTNSVRWSDAGPFAVVPRTVYRAAISDRAVRLYAVLAGYAGQPEVSMYRGKAQLAEDLDCHKTSVDRALAELVAIEAVSYQHEADSRGRSLANVYVLHVPATAGSQASDPPPPTGATPLRARASLEDPELLEAYDPNGSHARRGSQSWTVNRRTVTSDEDALARKILDEWNSQVGGRPIKAQGYLGKIVMRLREHPDLGFDEHAHIIRAALAAPWWKGAPTPSVVYGNDEQFERSLRAATASGAASGSSQAAFEIAMATLQRVREEESK